MGRYGNRHFGALVIFWRYCNIVILALSFRRSGPAWNYLLSVSLVFKLQWGIQILDQCGTVTARIPNTLEFQIVERHPYFEWSFSNRKTRWCQKSHVTRLNSTVYIKTNFLFYITVQDLVLMLWYFAIVLITASKRVNTNQKLPLSPHLPLSAQVEHHALTAQLPALTPLLFLLLCSK